MEARTGLVIGGVTAVAASIAVVTAVALANTMALADSPGASLASESVVVPSAASPSASPRATATATPEAPAPADAEVVEAPAPLVVAPPSGSHETAPPAAPVNPPAPDASGPEVATDIESVIAAARASNSWEGLRAWATAHGWTAARIERLVSRLEREAAENSSQRSESTEIAERPERGPSDRLQRGSVGAETEYDRRTASDRNTASDRSEVGRKRPAHAGSNVGNGNGADHDAKKYQSRNSPDERD